MRVLVTGHLGYIGTILTPILIAAGHEVVGLDSDLYARSTFGAGMPDILTINKDIRDIQRQDMEGFEAVLHLAGLSNDPLGDFNPTITYEINHQAAVRLAEMSKTVGITRFVFSSSCSTYGAAGEEPIDESGAFNPVTPYGETKVLVEQDVSKLADANFTPVFLRNATAFGVSPRLRFDLVINNLVAWALTTGLIYMKSDGTPWRPVVHIEDISRAFLVALEAPKEIVYNQAFNVGRNEDNYRISELAEIVAATVPNSRIEYAPGAGPDKRTYRVDCSKIQQVLPEFKPQWDARRGVEELYEAYLRVGLKQEEFEGPRYKRIAHIQYLQAQGLLDQSMRWRNE
jgi:nucleoside-diphosphate-sugar epimerase